MATPNMGLTKPTDHGSTDVWGDLLNDIIDLIDAHDHTTGKGVKVPSTALKIDADVSWSFGGTNFAITDAKAVDFTPLAAATMTSYSSALFANSSDANNLYYRNSAGTNVKITDGSTLNVSIVGGIGGDYSSVGALLDYDDATDTYRFRQETAAAVRQFGKVSCANLQLFEYLAAGASPVPSNSVRLASPAALAASYTVTFPAAVPANPAAVQSSAAGVLTFSNTFTQNLIAPEFRHTTALVQTIPVSAAIDRVATHTKGTGASSLAFNRYIIAASANPIVFPIDLPLGAVITAYTVFVDKNTDNTNTIAARLFSTRGDTAGIGVEAAISAGVTNSANAPSAVALTESGLAISILTGFQHYLVFTPGAGVAPAADELFHVQVSYTRP